MIDHQTEYSELESVALNTAKDGLLMPPDDTRGMRVLQQAVAVLGIMQRRYSAETARGGLILRLLGREEYLKQAGQQPGMPALGPEHSKAKLASAKPS